jgi:ketosteroid isomerase-like protein
MAANADAGIDALYDAWREAFRRRSVAAILELITPDYVLWPAGALPMTHDALKPALAAALHAYDVVPSFEREERIVSGDLAFERGWDVQQVRPRGGGDMTTRRQRVFLVLRRGSDGRWRFARGMSQPGPAADQGPAGAGTRTP